MVVVEKRNGGGLGRWEGEEGEGGEDGMIQSWARAAS